MASKAASEKKLASERYFRPEDQKEFRLAQLLLLLDIAKQANVTLNIERLGVLDFFSANPFLLVQPNDPEYRDLVLAGFSVKPLSYASPGHRFVTRRGRLQNDLAMLIAYGLVVPAADDGHRVYSISTSGADAASQLSSIYAGAYRSSVEIIAKKVRKVPEGKLQDFCRRWLQADPAMMDLLNL
ncbi:ABC-three component system middle component 2 [Streptomyces sp. NPDC088358]|uniref:ABC-three component system middle component 2 n=1 Tax=Streptomyces sp. NPDC088358 TaxID=3365857 RepID=UPI003830B9DA